MDERHDPSDEVSVQTAPGAMNSSSYTSNMCGAPACVKAWKKVGFLTGRDSMFFLTWQKASSITSNQKPTGEINGKTRQLVIPLPIGDIQHLVNNAIWSLW